MDVSQSEDTRGHYYPRTSHGRTAVPMRAPSSKGSEGRHLLAMTVNAAVESATATGNLDKALAIQQMYEQSLSDPVLAGLMDAVLAHKATQEQILQFRAVMKRFREINARFAKPVEPDEAEVAAALERGRVGSMLNPVLVDDLQSRQATPEPHHVEVVEIDSSDSDTADELHHGPGERSGSSESESSSDDDSAMGVETSGSEKGGRNLVRGQSSERQDDETDSDTTAPSSPRMGVFHDYREVGVTGYSYDARRGEPLRPRTGSRTPKEPEPYKNRYGLRDRPKAQASSLGSEDWALRPPKAVHWSTAGSDSSHGDSLKRKRMDTELLQHQAVLAPSRTAVKNTQRVEISTPLAGNIKALKAKLGSVPNSKTIPGRHILSIVVDGCMRRSGAEGNPAVGEAIRMFYDESLSDPSLAEFLDELFAGKATTQQVHRFQTYVRDHLRKAGAAVVQPVKSPVAANGVQSPAGSFTKMTTPDGTDGPIPVIKTVGERDSLKKLKEPEYEDTIIVRQPPILNIEARPVKKATPDLSHSSTPPPEKSGVADTAAVADGTPMPPSGLFTGIGCLPGFSNDDPPLPSFGFAHVQISSIRSLSSDPPSKPPSVAPANEPLMLIGSLHPHPCAGSSLDAPPSSTTSTSTLVDSDMVEG